eukprot:g3030.t1
MEQLGLVGFDRSDPFGQKKATLFAGTFRPQRSRSAKCVAEASLCPGEDSRGRQRQSWMTSGIPSRSSP